MKKGLAKYVLTAGLTISSLGIFGAKESYAQKGFRCGRTPDNPVVFQVDIGDDCHCFGARLDETPALHAFAMGSTTAAIKGSLYNVLPKYKKQIGYAVDLTTLALRIKREFKQSKRTFGDPLDLLGDAVGIYLGGLLVDALFKEKPREIVHHYLETPRKYEEHFNIRNALLKENNTEPFFLQEKNTLVKSPIKNKILENIIEEQARRTQLALNIRKYSLEDHLQGQPVSN